MGTPDYVLHRDRRSFRSLVWSEVDHDAGLAWAQGRISDGQLITTDRRQSAVFIVHLEGPQGWRLLAADQWLWQNHSVAFLRTDCPGLRRLLAEVGAEVGSTEPSGQDRWHVPAGAFHAVHGRLLRLYGPERRRFRLRRQSPVVREQHRLAVAGL